jgi:hypothetical protein
MCARRAVLQIPPTSSVPRRLPLYKRRHSLASSKSTLPQPLIPLHFISFISNTYKKPGGRVPPRNSKVWQLVTNHSPLLRTRRNARNPNPIMRLLHNLRTPPGWGSLLASHHSPVLSEVERALVYASSSPMATIPFRIIFFVHPHPLTPIESYSCKKQGGGGPFQSPPLLSPTTPADAQRHPQPLSVHGLTSRFSGYPGGGSLLTTHYPLLTFHP